MPALNFTSVRKINEIFVDMGSYSRETHQFLEKLKSEKPEVLPADSADSIAEYAGKINGINEVLARDHMKVAFFGRTSNGKSTVINAMLHSKILPSGEAYLTRFALDKGIAACSVSLGNQS